MKTVISTTLESMAAGEQARVVAVHGEAGFRRRLLELGLVPGTTVTRVGRTWFGDPLRIRVRDSVVALRRSDARLVEIGP